MADLLRIVERLRTQNKLDMLAEVRVRATMLYPVWETTTSDNGVVSELQELRLQAGTERLVTEADRAIQRDRQCFTLYMADYRVRHEERHTHAQAALTALEAHKGWNAVAEAFQTQLRNSILALDCESTIDPSLPASSCRDCGRSFKELSTDIELIEHRLQQALHRLDEALSPPQPKAKVAQTITMNLRSAEDLPRLYERIAEVAKAALTQPRRVRVTFEDVDEN